VSKTTGNCTAVGNGKSSKGETKSRLFAELELAEEAEAAGAEADPALAGSIGKAQTTDAITEAASRLLVCRQLLLDNFSARQSTRNICQSTPFG
jgi:hypothetical protein